MNSQPLQRNPQIMKDSPMPSPSGTTRTIIRVWIALTMVIFLAACSSDGGSAGSPETEPFVQPDVTTKIALADRPTSVNDVVYMFPQSFVENESAVIDFTASYDDGESATESVSVSQGDVVDFEGWAIHIERIGADSVLWWATGPNGEQISGNPRS